MGDVVFLPDTWLPKWKEASVSKKGKKDIRPWGHEGTFYVEEPWGEFSPRDGPGVEIPHTLTVSVLTSSAKYRFSDVGFSNWGAGRLILINVIFHNKCDHMNWIFSLFLDSLEENHLQDEGVCCLAKGLKRNSSLKVLK